MRTNEQFTESLSKVFKSSTILWNDTRIFQTSPDGSETTIITWVYDDYDEDEETEEAMDNALDLAIASFTTRDEGEPKATRMGNNYIICDDASNIAILTITDNTVKFYHVFTNL